jgi:flavin-dependent dehydrogenase
MPRARFDELLVRAACGQGATLREHTTAVAPLAHGEQVTGARLTSPSTNLEIRARVTLLATGANATAMNAFGLRSPLKPNAVAGRAYFDVPDRLASRFQHLCIAYEKTLCPGYGWIFPGPNRRFNVGVGFFSKSSRNLPSLHDLWTRFTSAFEPAAAIVRESPQVVEFRGAPLRTVCPAPVSAGLAWWRSENLPR